MLPVFGDLPLDAIKMHPIEVLKASLLAKGLSRKRVTNILACLGKMLRYAHEVEHLEVVPRVKLLKQLLKPPPQKFDFLTFEELPRLTEAVKIDPERWALVLLGADAGLRQGEIIALSWGDVDLVTGTLTVRRSSWKGIVDAPKSGRERKVPLTARLKAALKAHRHLKSELVRIAEEKFRADLYYRLAVFTIPLPSLRERGDDLLMLVRHYLLRFSRQLGREVNEISAEAFEQLRNYPWPGNIRELQSVLKQALLHASGTVLLPAFLPNLAATETVPALDGSTPGLDLAAFIRPLLAADTKNLYADTHDQVDRLLFTMALGYTRGNQRDAAGLLGISRQTMRVKMRALGIQVTHSVEANEDEPLPASMPAAALRLDSD